MIKEHEQYNKKLLASLVKAVAGGVKKAIFVKYVWATTAIPLKRPVEDSNFLVVAGPRQSGKTLALKTIVLENQGDRDVFYIDLNKVPASDELERQMNPVFPRKRWSLFTKAWMAQVVCDGEPEPQSEEVIDYYFGLLHKGNCLILIDGVDKNPLQQDSMLEALRSGYWRYPGNKFIVADSDQPTKVLDDWAATVSIQHIGENK